MSITKCKGFGCPFANSCVRFSSEKPKEAETWFRGVPFSDEDGYIECDRYLDKDETAVRFIGRLLNDS